MNKVVPLSTLFPLLLLLLLALPPPTLPAPSTSHRFSFHLPTTFAQHSAGTAGCCEFGQIPLPVTATRPLPKFLALGTHMSGTEFLNDVLALHPRLHPPQGEHKQLFMFGQWPLTWFAFNAYLNQMGHVTARDGMMYEVSAQYLAVPGAACRIKALLPRARLIVVLRDPVDRALAHYDLAVKLSSEGKRQKPRPFKVIIDEEIATMRKESCSFETKDEPLPTWNTCYKCWYITLEEALRAQVCEGEESAPGASPCNPRIKAGMFTQYGMYAAQIAWWLNFFPPSQFLFVNYDQLVQEPARVGNRIANLVGVGETFTTEEVAAAGLKEEVDPQVVAQDDEGIQGTLDTLKAFYKPHMEDLYALMDLLKVDIGEFPNFPRHQGGQSKGGKES